MKKYYIYHIKGVKIGVSVEPARRVKKQGYTDYEILETHNCKYLVSYREIALQKEYGYEVDTTMYYQTKDWRQKGCVNGGKTQGQIQGPKNVESGQLASIRTKQNQSKGGKSAVETGQLAEARSKANIRYTCPHCGNEGQYRAMSRWHGENCKHKPTST
jgi:predicted RNA-binding Zn-ribbon protein involved in translation (DUF1610 family)